uniref:Cadherin domain-containing protein n=1 Tax=Tetradesmus obliquus TaxID=3088 RepID=A0A383WID1_TETOB|eukprot:jgi/Sobl393_1/8242/SZX77235.1
MLHHLSSWGAAAVWLHLFLALAAVPSGAQERVVTVTTAAAAAAAPAAGVAPATIIVQLQPIPFTVADDKFVFSWEPGTTQRAVLQVLANDTGTNLTITAVKVPSTVRGSVFIPPANNKVIVYRVAPYSGGVYTDTFSYDAVDAFDPTPKTAQVQVIVGPGALPPPRGAKPDQYVIPGTAGQTLTKKLEVLQNDIGNGLLIIDITPLPVGKTLTGKAQIDAGSKSITYTVQDYNGVPFAEAFRYRVTDPSLPPGTVGKVTGARVDIKVGGSSPGQPLLAVNDAFTLNLKTGSTGKSWDLPVLLNDKGIGMFVDSFSKGSSFKGDLSIPVGKQSVKYTLSLVENGYDGAPITESFSYTVKNSSGASAQANVLVNVSPEALSANPDVYNLKLDAGGNLPPTILDLFANDTGNILSANLTSIGLPYGDLVWNQAKSYYVYTIKGYSGPSYSFDIEYTISDGDGNSDSTTAVVSVDASAVKIPVELTDNTYTGNVTTGFTFTAKLFVLDDDTPADTLRITAVENIGTPKGSAAVGTGGKWIVYTLPNSGFLAGVKFTDRFRYSAVNGTDPKVYTAGISLTITIVADG